MNAGKNVHAYLYPPIVVVDPSPCTALLTFTIFLKREEGRKGALRALCACILRIGNVFNRLFSSIYSMLSQPRQQQRAYPKITHTKPQARRNLGETLLFTAQEEPNLGCRVSPYRVLAFCASTSTQSPSSLAPQTHFRSSILLFHYPYRNIH